MTKLLQLQEKIVPELLQTLRERYLILRTIYFCQPVGRRAIAAHLKLPERLVRGEAERLRQQGLVDTDVGGMLATEDGVQLLWELADYMREIAGLSVLEEKLAHRFNLRKAVVIQGDLDKDPHGKSELGRAAAKCLAEQLRENIVVAVTGGTTLAQVAAHMLKKQIGHNITFVPARGGLGERVEEQANTIAATIAQHLGASYRLLYVPDNLQEEALRSLAKDAGIREILNVIRSAQVVMHGIGLLEEMARKRRLSEETVAFLREKGAVAEVFGFYLNKEGIVVHATEKLGLRFTDLGKIETVIAVAGGSSKGEAIRAVLSQGYQDILVTDEGAANVLLSE